MPSGHKTGHHPFGDVRPVIVPKGAWDRAASLRGQTTSLPSCLWARRAIRLVWQELLPFRWCKAPTGDAARPHLPRVEVQVPQDDPLVPTAGGQQPSIRAERQAAHGPGVPDKPLSKALRAEPGPVLLPVGYSRNVPQDDRVVIAPGREHLAVGGEGEALHTARLPRQRLAERLQRLGIPEVDSAIGATRCQQLSVRAEGHPGHGAGVTDQRAQSAAAADVPHDDRAVVRTTGQLAAIGAERHAQHVGDIADQRFTLFPYAAPVTISLPSPTAPGTFARSA